MGLVELLLLAIGLSMDAFAVSVCKGLAMKKVDIKSICICGLWFGGFQGLMPLVGYLLGINFAVYINVIAPWIAFVLLTLIGGNMARESFQDSCEVGSAGLDLKTMFMMAVATSIDALAVGITFACVPIKIFSVSELINTVFGVMIIAITTFFISCLGVKIGNVFGGKYKSKAELAGGLILIGIGIKIILEYFGVL